MPGAETFRGPADAYERLIGRYGPSLAAELVEFAGVRPGMRALDVGAGPGALARVLAERLGPENVAAAEPSESFADGFRARLPEVEIAVAPAEELPFPDASFDAALAQLVLNFMADAQAGVGQMARVTRQGGVVAACVWDYAEGMTLLRAFWDSAREVDPERGGAADEAVTMARLDRAQLADLWHGAGLEDVRTGTLVAEATWDGFEALWEPLTTGVAPSGAFVVSLDEPARAELHDAFKRRLGVADDRFAIESVAFAVAGRRA
jgi:SAM-dependent methyltransferase